MDSVKKELLSDIFKVDSFYYLFVNTVNVNSIVLFTYLSYCSENCIINNVISDVGIVPISMINDETNDERKLIRRKL